MFVAIDARWLWNRDMNRWQTYNGRVAAVAIDARWLWNRDRVPTIRDGLLRFVAIDARWLWNRSSASPSAARPASTRSRSMLDGCGIETTSEALGTVSPAPGRDRCSMAVESRLLLAERRTTVVLGSRSMLLMAVESRPCGRSRSGALDPCSSRSMLDGCGIETCPPSGKPAPCGSRSMLDGCGIETSLTAPPQSRLRCVAIDAR